MVAENHLYQSILYNLSRIPKKNLPQINTYLEKLASEKKSKNHLKIMQLAGSWSDMSDSDFNEYLSEAKNTSNGMFKSDFEL